MSSQAILINQLYVLEMMTSPHYDYVIPECCVTTMSMWGACNPWPSREAGFRVSRLQEAGHRRDQLQSKRTYPGNWAVGTGQEATSEAENYLVTEVNKVDIGTEATAFVCTTLLLEEEPEVSTPYHVQQLTWYPLILYYHSYTVSLHWCHDNRPHNGQSKEPAHHADKMLTHHWSDRTLWWYMHSLSWCTAQTLPGKCLFELFVCIGSNPTQMFHDHSQSSL